MEKGYYKLADSGAQTRIVAIHNKNGKGLLPTTFIFIYIEAISIGGIVAIHNKNGKGLLLLDKLFMGYGESDCRNPQ